MRREAVSVTVKQSPSSTLCQHKMRMYRSLNLCRLKMPTVPPRRHSMPHYQLSQLCDGGDVMVNCLNQQSPWIFALEITFFERPLPQQPASVTLLYYSRFDFVFHGQPREFVGGQRGLERRQCVADQQWLALPVLCEESFLVEFELSHYQCQPIDLAWETALPM